MLIANLTLFAFSSAVLFYVVKYRIHIYAKYEPTNQTSRKRVRPAISREHPDTEELVQTLVNLGAKPGIAKSAVIRAIENSPDQDFDQVLRLAIQECQNGNGKKGKP